MCSAQSGDTENSYWIFSNDRVHFFSGIFAMKATFPLPVCCPYILPSVYQWSAIPSSPVVPTRSLRRNWVSGLEQSMELFLAMWNWLIRKWLCPLEPHSNAVATALFRWHELMGRLWLFSNCRPLGAFAPFSYWIHSPFSEVSYQVPANLADPKLIHKKMPVILTKRVGKRLKKSRNRSASRAQLRSIAVLTGVSWSSRVTTNGMDAHRHTLLQFHGPQV